MSSASVDAVGESGGSRMTIAARTVALVVDRFATLTSVKSVAGNWISVSAIRKCPADKYVGLKGSTDKAP